MHVQIAVQLGKLKVTLRVPTQLALWLLLLIR
jgi:hypothetical protein